MAMPIQRYIKTEPAELNRLNIAYSKALRMIEIVERFDPLAENVAKGANRTLPMLARTDGNEPSLPIGNVHLTES